MYIRFCPTPGIAYPGVTLFSLMVLCADFSITSHAMAADDIDIQAVFELTPEDSLSIKPETIIRACSALLEKKDQQPRSSVEKAYEARARALIRQEKYKAAKEDLEELVKLRREDANVRCLLALTALRLGLKEQALEEGTNAIHLAPDSALGYAISAMVFSASGDVERGMRYATKAISLDPKEPMAHYVRASLYYVQLDALHCLQDITRLIELQPFAGPIETDKLYAMRGMCLLWLQRPKEAIPNFLMARQINSSSLSNTWGLWRAYADLGKWHLAFELARDCTRIDANDAQSLCCLAQSIAHIGKKDEARTTVEKAVKLSPNDATVLSLAAEVYVALGDYPLAFAYYDKILEQDPMHHWALRSKALLLASSPDEKARNGRQSLELALKSHENPGVPPWELWRSGMTVAIAQAECGNYKDAVRFAKRSLELMGPYSGYRNEYEQHLRRFERGEPYRLQPPQK